MLLVRSGCYSMARYGMVWYPHTLTWLMNGTSVLNLAPGILNALTSGGHSPNPVRSSCIEFRGEPMVGVDDTWRLG